MPRVTYADITIERGQYGQWCASALVDGYLWQKQYHGYTKREALKDAHTELNSEIIHYGQYVASALVDGYRWHKQYHGYTKREALKDAHTEINSWLEG